MMTLFLDGLFFKNPSKISFVVSQILFQIFFWEIFLRNSTIYLCEVEKCLVLKNYVKLTNVLIDCDKYNFEGSCKPYEVQHHIFFQWPFRKILIENFVFMLHKIKLEFFVEKHFSSQQISFYEVDRYYFVSNFVKSMNL